MWCTTFIEDGGARVEVGSLVLLFDYWDGSRAHIRTVGRYESPDVRGDHWRLAHGQRVQLTLPSGDGVRLFVKRIEGHTRLFVGAPRSVRLRNMREGS